MNRSLGTGSKALVVGVLLMLLLCAPITRADTPDGAALLGIRELTLTDTLGNKGGSVVALTGNASAAGGAMSAVLQSVLPGHGTVLWVQPKYDANGQITNDSETGFIVLVDGEPHQTSPSHGYLQFGYNHRTDGSGYYIIGEMIENGGKRRDIFLKFGGTSIKLGKDGVAQVYNKLQSVADNGRPMVEIGKGGLLLDNNGQLKKVSVGAPNSGGPGKRALVVDN